MNNQARPNIVVVGGGAGGLELVTKLGQSLGKHNNANITLVDEQPIHIWKPLLHEVAAGSLDSNIDQINFYAHGADNYFTFQPGRMEGLDRKAKQVLLAPLLDNIGAEIIPKRNLPYDILVIAVGSLTNDFSTPGIREHCMSLDNLDQANLFQQRYVNKLLCAQYAPESMHTTFNVVIIGGGATGVELAAELHHTLAQAAMYGMKKTVIKRAQISLVEAAPRILPPLPEMLATAVTKRLTSLGVTIYTNEIVTRATKEGIETKSGKFLPADLCVWAAGVKAPDFLANLDGLEVDKINRLLVNSKLQTTQDENIFAIGDCANFTDPASGVPVPPRAQSAHQQANVLVKSLQNLIKNEPLVDFKYQDRGTLVTLSCYDTFGNLNAFNKMQRYIGGKVAQFVYRSLYFMHLSALYGFLNALTVRQAKKLLTKRRPRLKLHFSKH
ncbi:respiratory NADH dehydrogenase 2/cupric reductase [Legionella lansingensis]|uniref:Respiratory NADH dehydrogenase 2/cupric reductase n=1 Tax=Legionella lansingensis TaxID=45067 RepID=A0A0W0VQ48_9GAMM|nr:NAD(P)/FAD-dependent oxidoreductase [Legionella lansingensis]KTD22279.1 respiratory NADH dehydrogenase 2/cupric reductase [Legionella lansingensis]SNV50630.1 respiratory NADH dehydrogenase 2/cupric reductase [Legionella lansingensis]